MPRDVNGNYTLPSGNPVVTNTLISSIWANTTLSDVATGLSNSLDRTGASSGMTGQLKATDGAIGAPGYSFNSEPASGLYRAGAADFRFSVAATDRVTIGANGLGATLVRAGDGAIGGPSFSWTNEPTSGWYRNAAGDLRFSIGGGDILQISSAVTIATNPVRAFNLQVTGTIPGNPSAGIYLFAANSLGFATAGVNRGSINSAGAWNISVPSSASLTMAVNGFAGQIPLVITSNTAGNVSVDDIKITRTGGTANTIQQGPNISLFDTTNTTVSVLQQSGGQTELWQFNGGWVQRWRITAAGLFQALDQAGTMQDIGWRDMPQTGSGSYTFVIGDRGKHVFANAAGTVITIPSNASVAFPVGTVLTVLNNTFSSGTCQVAINTDTMTTFGFGGGTRTLAVGGMLSCVKVAGTTWQCYGSGVS